MINCLHPLFKTPTLLGSSFPSSSSSSSSTIQRNFHINSYTAAKNLNCCKPQRMHFEKRGRSIVVCGWLFPVDPWTPTIDSQSIASQLFAVSLFPYIGFLYFITKSKSAPKLTLFGFYFLLAFVGATIPAGIYAKVQYGTSLSNVDWLHGGAESLLTLTNLFIVLGLRQALRKANNAKESRSNAVSDRKDENAPSI